MISVETDREAREVMLEHCDPLSDRDLGCLHRASHVAEFWHRSQFRATGERYITHTNGVEHILVLAGFERDIKMRVDAKLHDVIEDCEPEKRDNLRLVIRKRFGLINYLIVEALTKKKGVDPATQLKRAVDSWWWLGLWRATLLKLADILFNLTTIEGFRNYNREMLQYAKAKRMLDVALIPTKRRIPQQHLGAYNELVTSIISLMHTKRQATIAREREHDLGYFPVV